MAFNLDDPRTKYLVRNAVRWHLTGFDASNRAEDADGVWEHGWSAGERKKIDEILNDPKRLKKVLLAWVAFDQTKPEIRQNWSNQEEIKVMLKDDVFD